MLSVCSLMRWWDGRVYDVDACYPLVQIALSQVLIYISGEHQLLIFLKVI